MCNRSAVKKRPNANETINVKRRLSVSISAKDIDEVWRRNSVKRATMISASEKIAFFLSYARDTASIPVLSEKSHQS